MFDTKGIDLLKVKEEAKVNGNEKFAELIENNIANLQTIYDVVAQKQSATDEELWRIDAEYVKGLLK